MINIVSIFFMHPVAYGGSLGLARGLTGRVNSLSLEVARRRVRVELVLRDAAADGNLARVHGTRHGRRGLGLCNFTHRGKGRRDRRRVRVRVRVKMKMGTWL